MDENKQIKTRDRVRDHGEVFTAEREVKAMCDLVKDESERIDSRFLEPACGDGNFLAEILTRKLATVADRYHGDALNYERGAVLAATSIYGIDILADNVAICRDRLFDIWDEEYTKNCGKTANDETREAVKFILSRNIVCGNALTTYCVDEKQNNTKEPIVFSEWTFVSEDEIQRTDYTFEELLQGDSHIEEQITFNDLLFSNQQVTLGELPKSSGQVLKKYTAHYRRIQDYD